MRIRTVTVPDGTDGRGYGGNVTLYITGDYAADLARALDIEHPCEDPSCDVAAAMAQGYVYTAADLLSGATETPVIGAVHHAHTFNRTAIDDAPDWANWLAYHDAHGRQCPDCGAWNYESDLCGNCGANIPTPSDEMDVFATDPGGPFRHLGKQIAGNVGELLAWMDAQGYWPDVYWVSDHGNIHGPLNLEDNDDGA